jgi:ribosome-associated heat shock protein Hsp15
VSHGPPCYGKNLMSDVRIDKWLWAARFFKSRTLAAAACSGGKVDVNGDAAKPARAVRPGDLLRVTLPRIRRIVRVTALAERRGAAREAAALYEDLTPPPPPREARPAPTAYRPPGVGRPTKRERRRIDRLVGG